MHACMKREKYEIEKLKEMLDEKKQRRVVKT